MATDLFLFQLVDEIDHIEPAHPMALVDGCVAEGQCQMGFPGPCTQNPNWRSVTQALVAKLRAWIATLAVIDVPTGQHGFSAFVSGLESGPGFYNAA